MLDKDTKIEIGKYACYLLRHCPQDANLDMDSRGWVDADALIAAINSKFPDAGFGMEALLDMVSTDKKQRYSMSMGNEKIRANQGHSIPVDLELGPVTPPPRLYHGTATKFIKSIMKEGIKSRSRNYVHLSGDYATAIEVGKRHGTPVILEIDAEGMRHAGHKFYLSENGVWLTDYVPPEFIRED